MYYKKTPKFLFCIILIALICVTGIVTWSAYIYKPYIVKAQSVITVENKSPITVPVNAKIKTLNIFEGKKVIKGDILIEQETLEIDLQIDQIKVYVNYYELRTRLFERLIKYIDLDYSKDEAGQCFDKKDMEELEFYNYMSGYELEKKQYTGNSTLLKKLKQQNLDTYYAQRESCKIEYNKYFSQIEAYQKNKDAYIIRAENDGVVHLNVSLNKGMFLQAGSILGTITNDGDEMIAECYLSASDRPKVKVGDRVKLALDGLSQNEFGTIDGEVTFIDSDATSAEGNYYFVAKIKLDKTSLKSEKNTIQLSFGMKAEARIIYNETTYLKYFLEQIGIRVK